MPQFKRIAVVGAGLIGGSVLLAAARRQLAGSLAGWSRSAEARVLLQSYAVAEIFDNPVDAVRGADIVIIATPVDKMAETFRAIGPGLSPGTLVTVASRRRFRLPPRVCHRVYTLSGPTRWQVPKKPGRPMPMRSYL